MLAALATPLIYAGLKRRMVELESSLSVAAEVDIDRQSTKSTVSAKGSSNASNCLIDKKPRMQREGSILGLEYDA
jgi:hypothetical protein